jgi:hypothetical protein
MHIKVSRMSGSTNINPGELLTRGTIWIALLLYAAGSAMLLVARGRQRWLAIARMAWTFGCTFFLAHVVCAFAFYHQWSHAAAYAETARQTAEMTRFRSGSGLYLNYVFGAVWLAMVAWWWVAPASFASERQWPIRAWHSFALFMIFNGTVVFGHGPVRVLGLVICGSLLALWWWQRRHAGTYRHG